MKGWIALGIALVALVLGLGCQAKDYKERIGQYQVNFTLPDDVASTIVVNKTISRSETLDSIPFYRYSIVLIPKTDRNLSFLWIAHYNSTRELSLADSAEDIEGMCKGLGYNVANSATRSIDGHEGYIVNCLGNELKIEMYRFAYQLDSQTTVNGELYLDWDTAVVPLLKSLHVKEVP